MKCRFINKAERHVHVAAVPANKKKRAFHALGRCLRFETQIDKDHILMRCGVEWGVSI
jgi:hypothetical protein